MLHTLSVLTAEGTDPRRNLALEATLLHQVRPGEEILYLWQNQRTVVIGRNQLATNECRIQALEADGGHLVRRLSGGGAVYHDLGNLNFTFLTCRRDYDVTRQTEVILQAVRALGIPAERNGRNDLTVDGQKFSGHAYYQTGDQCYHHGTLMVSVDLAPLEGYLNVSPLKLQAKGVASVRARVGNLADFCPGLTIPPAAPGFGGGLRPGLRPAGPHHDGGGGRPPPSGPVPGPIFRPGLDLRDSPPPGHQPGGAVCLGHPPPGLQPGRGASHPSGPVVGRPGGGLPPPGPQALAGCPWQRSALEARLLALPGRTRPSSPIFLPCS